MERPSGRSLVCPSLLALLLGQVLAQVPCSFADTGAEPAASDLGDIRMDVAELRRDLTILGQELLFPVSSQMPVYLAMDAGEFLQLDAVTLQINGEEVARHPCAERRSDAHREDVNTGLGPPWLSRKTSSRSSLNSRSPTPGHAISRTFAPPSSSRTIDT